MSRCLARLVDDKFRGKFADGHHFHIEQRCPRSVTDGQQLCEKCITRPRDEPKNHPSALHGLIGREIPAWSHIFGSAWYQSKVGKYGTPSEEEMGRAKKAVEENAKDVPVAKARKFKVAASSAPVAAVVVSEPPPAPAPAPVAVKKTPVKRKPKAATLTATEPTPVAPALVEPKAIESKENALKISDEDILIISVRKFEHNGRHYFLHSGKDKLYSVGKDGQPLAYVGRYNRQSDTIDADFPDSDQEY